MKHIHYIVPTVSLSLLFAALSFAACGSNEPEFELPTPTPEEPDAVSLPVQNSNDEAGFTTYFNPTSGRCGDPMPFFDPKTKEYRVLYLQEYDSNGAYYHPIFAANTTDCANYQAVGELVPTGNTPEALDGAIGTGCAAYDPDADLYYIYYTGHTFRNGSDYEVVMRATSKDFRTWTKDTPWLLRPEDFGYAKTDFRDPQVFRDDAGLWHMIISAKGKFAEFTSADCANWQHAGDFAGMYWGRMLECPDVFKMGDYWYLVYSDAYRSAEGRKVKYFMGRTLDELKSNVDSRRWPDDHEGILDSRSFYAGKTAGTGSDRYIWGWCPFRRGNNFEERNVAVGGDSEPLWSGALVCHKLIQHADGTLTCGAVPALDGKYNKAQTIKVLDAKEAQTSTTGAELKGNGYVFYDRLAQHNHISMTVKTGGAQDKFGFSFVRGTDGRSYYTLVVNPENNGLRKVNFEHEGPGGTGFIKGGDGYMFKQPADGVYNIDVYTDNSILTLYINDVCAYTQRFYGIAQNGWSINSYNGANISVSNLKLNSY